MHVVLAVDPEGQRIPKETQDSEDMKARAGPGAGRTSCDLAQELEQTTVNLFDAFDQTPSNT